MRRKKNLQEEKILTVQITLSNRRDNTRRSGQKTLVGNSEEKKGQMANIHMKKKKHANGNKMSYHLQNHVEKILSLIIKASFVLEKQAVSYTWQIGF